MGASADDPIACEGSSPEGTRRRSAELESFDAMILCGHSPTGPLPQYSSEGHSSSKPSKPTSTPSHAILPQTLTLGFKVGGQLAELCMAACVKGQGSSCCQGKQSFCSMRVS